jgi:hypothetical protein
MLRLPRAVALLATVTLLVVASGAPTASGEEDDGPVGYTLGVEFKGVTPICDFFSVELATGVLHRIAAPVFCGDGLTFDDDGTLYAYRNPNVISGPPPQTQLMTIDVDDGSQHVIGDLPPVTSGDGGMTFDEDGNLWLYGRAVGDPDCGPTLGACLWKVDPKDASTTFIGPAPEGTNVLGLAASCEDVLAITTAAFRGPGTGGSSLQEVNTRTAALEHVVDVPGVSRPMGLDFGDDGRLWAISLGNGPDGPFTNRIDPSDGTSTSHEVSLNGGPYNGALFGLAVDPIECTEPAPPVPPPAPTPVAVAPAFTG